MDSSTGKMFGGAPKMVYVDNAKYYEILGVSKNDSQDALKKAYREAAMKYHPDKGGDPEKFKELAQAYGVLGDPEKRQIYNLHRQEIVRTLKVSLTDLYNGTSKKENFSRIAICSNCNGKGSKSGASIMECSGCQGSGMVPYIRHFIPGMKHPCYQCKGTGETLSETINDDDLCEQCEGKKIVREKVVLQVYVRKGMQNGQNITFTREVVPTKRGGGVVIILQQEEHPKFKRKGDDLYVEHTLSPREALFGFQFGLTHLDNRRLIIKSQPGEVVKPGQVKEINGEGMPMYQRPSMRGKLYIHFTVECPDALTLTPGEAAMKHHPDKGGDPEKFKELAQAHEVLSDPEKREIYNRIYNRHRQDIVRVIKVSLTDLYNGTFKKENFSRNSICSKCKGKGSKSGPAIMQCSGCRGSGMELYMRHLPQPIPLPCYQCQGTGETLSETISDEDRCEQCKGEQVVREKEVLEVPVEKGMQNGQKITFPREVFPTTGGGIVFILQQEEHPKFKRKGDDLFVEHTLSLTEALFGFQFGLTHLDNRQLKIKSQPGEVVKPGQFKEINGEGMPMYERPSMRGKLYIHFTVEFPDGPTPDQCKAIEAVLAPRRSTQLTDMEVDEGEEITLHDGNQQQAQEAYDDMHCEMMKMKDMRGEGAMRKRVGRPLWMMRTCNKAKRGNDDMHSEMMKDTKRERVQ